MPQDVVSGVPPDVKGSRPVARSKPQFGNLRTKKAGPFGPAFAKLKSRNALISQPEEALRLREAVSVGRENDTRIGVRPRDTRGRLKPMPTHPVQNGLAVRERR